MSQRLCEALGRGRFSRNGLCRQLDCELLALSSAGCDQSPPGEGERWTDALSAGLAASRASRGFTEALAILPAPAKEDSMLACLTHDILQLATGFVLVAVLLSIVGLPTWLYCKLTPQGDELE